MEIRLLNVQTGDTVAQEIFVVKCQIKNFEKANMFVEAIQMTKDDNPRKIKEQLCRKGKCKILLHLFPGLNEVELRYGDITKKIQLHYNFSQKSPSIQAVYVYCNDQNIEPNFQMKCQKLLLGLKLAQCVYAEKIFEGTGHRKTFNIEPSIVPLKINQTLVEVYKMSDSDLWTMVGKSLISSQIWKEHTKYIAFVSFTKYLGIENDDYSYANIKRHTLANPALSAGGLALLGTGSLYTWPSQSEDIKEFFKNKTQIDMATQLDDSNYRRTMGGCFSTSIGSVCHELGHIFDLGHTKNGIMGNGFDYIGRVFLNAELTTEDLPDRKVDGITGGDDKQVVIKNRLIMPTKIKPQGKFLHKYHEQTENDLTFFMPNNISVLFYHKWFNEFSEKFTIELIGFHVIKSKKPLAIVELRRTEDEMALEYRVFEDEIYEFDISQLKYPHSGVLFASDIEGNILKQTFSV